MPTEITTVIQNNQIDKLSESISELRDELNSALGKLASLQTIANNLSKLSEGEITTTNGTPTGALQEYIVSTIQDNFNGSKNDIWLQPSSSNDADIPKFITKQERLRLGSKTRFISFLNFKGGVGKTALSSNLTAAFASGNFDSTVKVDNPLRVLAVDLDFQGSLSDRCARPYELIDAIEKKVLSALLFFHPNQLGFSVDDLCIPFIKCPNARLIPTNDYLDAFDNKIFNYQAFKISETRFSYRPWFHREEFLKKNDLVIFDCPPRKTASTICALLASDFVFIPTAPETLDNSSVIRTVKWLIEFKNKLNAPFQIGGVIFNRTYSEKKLSEEEIIFKTKIERGIAQTFKDNPLRSVDPAPRILDSFIPKRTGKNSIIGNSKDALPGAYRQNQFFTRLATEILQRIYL
ncbi:MAG: ParA family protein [Thermoguttaceae bacterium]|nr:ParA family protein [Thermoguttaceae bacterium]